MFAIILIQAGVMTYNLPRGADSMKKLAICYNFLVYLKNILDGGNHTNNTIEDRHSTNTKLIGKWCYVLFLIGSFCKILHFRMYG